MPKILGRSGADARPVSPDPPTLTKTQRTIGLELALVVRRRGGRGLCRCVLPFFHTATGMPIDVVLSGSGLEDEFLARAAS